MRERGRKNLYFSERNTGRKRKSKTGKGGERKERGDIIEFCTETYFLLFLSFIAITIPVHFTI